MIRQNLKDSWDRLSLLEQMGNIGSEVGRAARSEVINKERFRFSVERALELFDLTLADSRWVGRLQEVGKVKEIFCDIVYGEKKYGTTLSELEKYFTLFAIAARSKADS